MNCDVCDVLTISFESGIKEESALCVARKHGEEITILKMELGEQADILYHLLGEPLNAVEKGYNLAYQHMNEVAEECVIIEADKEGEE